MHKIEPASCSFPLNPSRGLERGRAILALFHSPMRGLPKPQSLQTCVVLETVSINVNIKLDASVLYEELLANKRINRTCL